MLGVSNCLLSVYSWVIWLPSSSLADRQGSVCLCVCVGGALASSSQGNTCVEGRQRGLPHASSTSGCSSSLFAAGHLPWSRADGTRPVSSPELLQVTTREMAWEEMSRALCQAQHRGGWCLASFIRPVGSFQPQRAKGCSPLALLLWWGKTHPAPLLRSLAGAKQSKKSPPKFL